MNDRNLKMYVAGCLLLWGFVLLITTLCYDTTLGAMAFSAGCFVTQSLQLVREIVKEK